MLWFVGNQPYLLDLDLAWKRRHWKELFHHDGAAPFFFSYIKLQKAVSAALHSILVYGRNRLRWSGIWIDSALVIGQPIQPSEPQSTRSIYLHLTTKVYSSNQVMACFLSLSLSLSFFCNCEGARKVLYQCSPSQAASRPLWFWRSRLTNNTV